mmetsp:Transcript_3712/g.10746  ORF Transcript_3712/g.10746 Transcript_3712/m.10746 type:complete len:100 (-) Transcript_3712:444-743(-)
MPKNGIHPMLYQMTVVLRNGASIQVPTTIPRASPLFLKEDVTNNPLWTGKTEGLGAEDEHMQTFMTRFAGLDSINDAGAKKGTGGGGSAAEGKGKGDAK